MSKSTQIQVAALYRFHALNPTQIQQLRVELEAFASQHDVRGLCLLGAEGINLTVSAPNLDAFKSLLSEKLGLADLWFKDSLSDHHPFHVFKVKIKKEIVTIGRPDLKPDGPRHNHLSPEEWRQAMNDPEVVIIDTRNDYEVDIGKFKGARDFRIKEFRDFPQAVRDSGLKPDQKILMYCTGGIRCEKAILAMEEQGFKNVHQLNGGILNYLKEFPESEFEGECFVFDYRVAVDQKLRPSARYRLCPHCGEGGDIKGQCVQCGSTYQICRNCQKTGISTCSKNCAHHHAIGSASHKVHLQERRKRTARA